MKALIKKEFSLCLHPTAFVFLTFAALVFVPNYPYEVIFFFSGLSIFFISLSARENGDLAFTCSLPVKKRNVPLARIIVAAMFQCALLALTAICIVIKQASFPEALLVNLAGNSANLAFCGFGALLLGAFNLTFFPLHFSRPNTVGVPFVISSAVQFALIGLLILVRHLPFAAPITTPDPESYGIKLVVLSAGLFLYVIMTVLAAQLSMKKFENVDL